MEGFAQVWAPLAAAALIVAWGAISPAIRVLWRARLGGVEAGAAAPRGVGLEASYILALALAVILPFAAAVAWSLTGEPAEIAGLTLIPKSEGGRFAAVAGFAAPFAATGAACLLLRVAQPLAFGVAVATALVFSGMAPWPIVIALGLVIGAAFAMASSTAGGIELAAAGAVALALTVAAVLSGPEGLVFMALALALTFGVAALAGRGRANLPRAITIPVLAAFPVLVLAWLDGRSAAFDLAAPLASDSGAALLDVVIMFAAVPVSAAPALWLSLWTVQRLARAAALASEGGRLASPIFEYLGIVLEIVLALVLCAAAALLIAAGLSVFDRAHELGGARNLLSVRGMIDNLARAPASPARWWVYTIMALPLVPALVHLLGALDALVVGLLNALGIGGWFAGSIKGSMLDRAAAGLVALFIRAAPLIALVLLVAHLAPILAGPIASAASTAGASLLELARTIADGIRTLSLK